MSLPNATALISTLPSGMRATVLRGSTVATYAVRAAVRDAGAYSGEGLDRDVKSNVWTISADFVPKIKIGDVLTVDGTSAVVLDAILTIGNLVNRATVLLFEDTVTVISNGQTVQALNNATTDNEDLTDYGERGISRGRLRIIAAQMTQPAKGATILVSGVPCIVGNVSTDPRNKLMTIMYQQANPLTSQVTA